MGPDWCQYPRQGAGVGTSQVPYMFRRAEVILRARWIRVALHKSANVHYLGVVDRTDVVQAVVTLAGSVQA